MNSENPRLIDLPANIRPRDALGEACHLQLVIDSSSNKVLKFFHASVPIAWGVVRVFCNNHAKVINYKLASSSDRVKCAFVYMLNNITGEQWMTQSLGQKVLTKTSKCSDKDQNSWDPSPDELREGINFINQFAPPANGKNEQFLWALLSIRDKECPIFAWPMHVVSRACQNRSIGNSQAEPEYFFPLLVSDLNEAMVMP